MKTIEFWKMNGSGNDFILIDNRDGSVGEDEMGLLVKRACRRRESVGADGLIFVTGSDHFDFGWRYFNADGGEVEMCGNGSRCVARFAYLKGIAKSKMTFGTLAGPVSAEDLSSHPVFEQGRSIRYHSMFSPEGTNANFMKVLDHDTLEIRTYERGVEDETLACGTGAIASALVASARETVNSPVRVRTKGGEELRIHFRKQADTFTQIWLEGSTSIVFQAQLNEEAL
jgi:diaminopimelate epimerase